MEDKLITIAILPYHRAEILRTKLEALGIECQLANINLVQGAIASGVRVRILEKDLKASFVALEDMFGKVEIPEEEIKNTVLIPVDFSECSFNAAMFGIEMAKKLGATVEMIHSYSSLYPYTIPYGDPFIGESNYLYTVQVREENTQKEFQEFIEKLKKETGDENWEATKPDYIIKGGEADEDIVNYANKNRPRAVVMGIKGASNDDSGLIGSITSEVISKTKVPVLAIPEETPIRNINEIKHVMYATNFDDKDVIAIEKLVGLLRPFDVKLHCIHVGRRPDEFWDKARLEGMKVLMKEKYPENDFICDFIEHNDVMIGIESYIRDKKIDVISMTTHKRSVLTRMFNPGMARKMVFHTNTPVLVFHA